MKILVIAPGPTFSTLDVYTNAVDGLRALGAEVIPVDFHEDLRFVASGEDPPEPIMTYAAYRALAVAMATQPDFILVISGTLFPLAAASLLGQYARTGVWLTESPYQVEQELHAQGAYHVAFTNERRMVERLVMLRHRQGHPHPLAVFHLRHGYNPYRHAPQAPDPRYASDVCFIGSPYPERQALLRGVNWDGIDFRWRGVLDTARQDELETPVTVIPNSEAHRYYAATKIALNQHRTLTYYERQTAIAGDEAESLNPRVYELAAAGVFQLCDDARPELGETFGASIPTYRAGNSADLEAQIRHYLAHPEERAAKVAEARLRVGPHSCVERMRLVLEVAGRKDL